MPHTTEIKINKDWCKKCGICRVMCPKGVLEADVMGTTIAAHPEECIACRICERICPDYAINIEVKDHA